MDEHHIDLKIHIDSMIRKYSDVVPYGFVNLNGFHQYRSVSIYIYMITKSIYIHRRQQMNNQISHSSHPTSIYKRASLYRFQSKNEH